jgi:hypothetical protein
MSQEDTILTIPEEIVIQIAEVGIQGPPGADGADGADGAQGPPGTPGSAPQAYTHDQASPSATWTIVHSLGYYPNVAVVDSAGDDVEGLVTYADVNTVTIAFSAAFGGKAYLS